MAPLRGRQVSAPRGAAALALAATALLLLWRSELPSDGGGDTLSATAAEGASLRRHHSGGMDVEGQQQGREGASTTAEGPPPPSPAPAESLPLTEALVSEAPTPTHTGAPTASGTAAPTPPVTPSGSPAPPSPSGSASPPPAPPPATGGGGDCPRWVPVAGPDAGAADQAPQRVDACAPRVVNNLRLVNGGPPAWRAYAARVARRVDAAMAAAPRPPVEPAAAREVVEEAAAAAALWGDIAASQTAADCATARVLLLEYPINGFASAFGLFGGALMQARLRNRLLVMDEGSGWAYNPGRERCPHLGGGAGGEGGQWECFFQRVGSCSFAAAAITPEQRAAAVPAHSDGGSVDGGPRVVTMNLNHGSMFWHEHLAGLPVPQPYTRWGPAWWRTHHFLYLWRLNANVTGEVEAAVAAAGAGAVGGPSAAAGAASSPPAAAGSFLAWHVRHGDKVVERHATFAAGDFLPALAGAANATAHAAGGGGGGAARRVFLASDDPAVAAAAPALLAPEGYAVYSLADRLKLGDSLTEAAAKARGDGASAYDLAVDAIANVWMMSEGNGFVGIFHSNFGRLAAELQYAKGHTLAPYAFQDATLCDHSGHNHPDRDGYFDHRAPWYLPLRRTRALLGLPPGLFIE